MKTLILIAIVFALENLLAEPKSQINLPKSKIVKELTTISGTASDVKSKIVKVKIRIFDETDNLYFDGENWTLKETWLDANGTEKWEFIFKNSKPQHEYKVKTKAINSKGEEEKNEKEETYIVKPE